MDVKPINAIILSGGESKRMGQPKAFLPLGESTFIEELIKTLTPLVKEVIISGNPEIYGNLGCKVVEDTYVQSGPLAGILAGLQASKTEWNFVLSVDSPFINATVINHLKQFIHQQDVVIAKTPERVMPLIGFYHKNSCKTIEQALKDKQYKVMQVLNTLNTEEILMDTQQQTLLKNVNTPEDYKSQLQKVAIHFFGQLAEIVGDHQIEYTIPIHSTIQEVKTTLFKNYPQLEGKVYKMALNNTFVTDDTQVTISSKIDVLPAFAGG